MMEYTDDGGTQERIIGEARRLFSARGFSGTSLSDIAAAVGIQKASLYHFFASKEEIYFTVINRIIDEITDIFTEESDGDPRNAFVRVVERSINVGIESGAGILSQEKVSAETCPELMHAAYEKYHTLQKEITAFLKHCGTANPAFASQVLIDSNQMYLWRYAHGEELLSVSEYISNMADVLLPHTKK